MAEREFCTHSDTFIGKGFIYWERFHLCNMPAAIFSEQMETVKKMNAIVLMSSLFKTSLSSLHHTKCRIIKTLTQCLNIQLIYQYFR